jgi:hypothetical protein
LLLGPCAPSPPVGTPVGAALDELSAALDELSAEPDELGAALSEVGAAVVGWALGAAVGPSNVGAPVVGTG